MTVTTWQALQHDFVTSTLRSVRWPACPDEYALQAAAAELLERVGAPVDREVVLSARDRPDLMCGGVAIECKVAGSASALHAQVSRYASHDQVDSLIVLTRRAGHLLLPSHVAGKPLTVIHTESAL